LFRAGGREEKEKDIKNQKLNKDKKKQILQHQRKKVTKNQRHREREREIKGDNKQCSAGNAINILIFSQISIKKFGFFRNHGEEKLQEKARNKKIAAGEGKVSKTTLLCVF